MDDLDAPFGINTHYYHFDGVISGYAPVICTNVYTNAETHYTYADPNALWGNCYRGYTGHEHLDLFGVINMNGRLYDPLVARMLSPDNFVQDPSYSQNFNRYSYVYNNPLHYTDPSGEIALTTALIIGGALIGGYIGGIAASGHTNPFKQQFWNDGWEGVIVGGVVGAMVGASSGMVLGAKAAKAKGGVGLTGMQKGFVGGTKSATINTVSQFNKDYGLGNLAYVAAGFVGGYLGAAPVADGGIGYYSMIVGGSLNAGMGFVVPEWTNNGQLESPYELGQLFIGGALSSYIGISSAKSVGAKKAKTSLTKKLTNKAFSYGVQNSAADFAYSSQEKYLDRKLGHLGIFGMGALGGVMQHYATHDRLFVALRGNYGISKALGGMFSSQMLGYGIQYAGTIGFMGYIHSLTKVPQEKL